MFHATKGNSYRLARKLLYRYAADAGQLSCYQCGKFIMEADFSIEHMEPWTNALDREYTFFALNNIAYSHLLCNTRAKQSGNARKTHCPQGHPYNEVNTYRTPDNHRQCRACANQRKKDRTVRRLNEGMV